jgi:superfamily II DNA or RNA helicase
MELRSYQAAAVCALREMYKDGARKICVVAPTGAGKTVIAAHLVQSAHGLGKASLFVAHRMELLDQLRKVLQSCGLSVGMIKAGQPEDRTAAIQLASIQTLVRRELPPADLVIVDEAHRAIAKSYRCLSHYPLQLGLTATPWRLDGKGLGDVYDYLLEVSRPSELVRDGWLIDPKIYAPSQPMESPRSNSYDYTLAECDRVMNHSHLIGDIVEHWTRLADRRSTVCFASGINHSRAIMERFQAAGVTCSHVDGSTSDVDREKILLDLAEGRTQIVSNVDIITEGYDLPRLSCAIMARPTLSLSKFLQMAGRIMRPLDGKSDALILDHAGCSVRHGFPADDRDWQLIGREDRRRRQSARVCSYCFSVCRPAIKVCDHCGKPFPIKHRPRKPKKEKAGELVRVEIAKIRSRKTSKSIKLQTLLSLQKIARQRGYKPGWASVQYKLRYGDWP